MENNINISNKGSLFNESSLKYEQHTGDSLVFQSDAHSTGNQVVGLIPTGLATFFPRN